MSIEPIRFNSVLLKVASRCNLACNYCYMYEHADQTWRQQPRFLSSADEASLVARVAEYIGYRRIDRFSVILHGGEPLLAGAERLANLAADLRAASPDAQIDIGMQTNGLLLTAEALQTLVDADISVSLSLDGPEEIHDRHRRRADGGPSHAQVMTALSLLREVPNIFAGVIAVIDPHSDPTETVRWFAALGIPALDFLLPDANHSSPPPGRSQDPDLYSRWLLESFDTWFDEVPELPLRTYDAILRAAAGGASGTDAFGLGSVTSLCVETDGGYHDLDVLKTTFEGRTKLVGDVRTTPLAEMEHDPLLQEHAQLLVVDGLSATCQKCPELATCGGGSVPHRFDGDATGIGAWTNPSVYCHELLTLFGHARTRMKQQMELERTQKTLAPALTAEDWSSIDGVGDDAGAMPIFRSWAQQQVERLSHAIDGDAEPRVEARAPELQAVGARMGSASPEVILGVATRPATQLILRLRDAHRTGAPLLDTSGNLIEQTETYWSDVAEAFGLEPRRSPAIHRDDPVLRLPFASPIEFLAQSDPSIDRHREGVAEALRIVSSYSEVMARELVTLCADIQLIHDTSAHPDKSVSFSDDVVPGALFVSPPIAWSAPAVYDMADSLIHEYRHQKLYLIGTQVQLVDRDWPLVSSPWREEPRPPSGLLHATFVFVELLSFWRWVIREGPSQLREQGIEHVRINGARLDAAFRTLEGCALSPSGRSMCRWLATRHAG